MNKRTFVIVLGSLCIFLMFYSGGLMAQASAVYSICPSPYPVPLTEVLTDDGLVVSDVEAVVKLERVGKPSLYLAFLADRFYVLDDLTGLKRVYLFGYHETIAGYQSELSLSGIPPGQLSTDELVNCILKYHSRT